MLCFYILTIITFIAVDALSFAGQRSYGSMIFHMTGRAPTDYENYGCWCRTGSKPERYVDDVDLCCKFRFHCYDVALQSSKCNGIAAEYSIQLDRSIKCIDYNETCAYELCICDKQAVECFKKNLDKINDTFFNLPKKECRFEQENTTTTDVLCQKAKWNSSGITVATGEGIFSIFVDVNNNIYTAQADFYNQRVFKNSSDGKTVYQVVDFEEVQSATNWRDQFRYPTALFVDNMENLYAISSLGSRMQSVMNGKPPNGFENIVTYYGYTVEKLTRGSTKQVRVAELKNALRIVRYRRSISR
ncbi:unnamed protein product [Rotaria socialis]|uniref:Phospholipase A2-like central domain-containing protein n=1 Tax=Rotaria socialis TaxID=392032 RepID=A0A818QWF3_9BILA|nr:unnamed protein product [Rotaria socialis]CAF3647889.1 unnamed protein product [Rotaria socialis]CAF4520689.1 unnamed protein product [Rotaria socialis]CAF4554893.1 unnamed protein product [Rotaria socialis]